MTQGRIKAGMEDILSLEGHQHLKPLGVNKDAYSLMLLATSKAAASLVHKSYQAWLKNENANRGATQIRRMPWKAGGWA